MIFYVIDSNEVGVSIKLSGIVHIFKGHFNSLSLCIVTFVHRKTSDSLQTFNNYRLVVNLEL